MPGTSRRREEELPYEQNRVFGGDAMRLIDNILQYAERIVDLAERREFLNDTLMGTIGLTEEEIAKITL